VAQRGGGRPGKGPWPALVVDAIEPLAAKHAKRWAAWGHRKIWRLGGVVEDWAKLCLACPTSTTQGHREAIGAIEAAISQAEVMLGGSLLDDCTDPATGELTPVVLVTDIQSWCCP
jgi:hypothetical protein